MSNTKTIKANDLTALLAAAKLPERTVELCLRGDLQGEWEELDRQRRTALRAAQGAESLGGSTEDAAILAAMEAVEAQMRDSVVAFTLRALNRRTYQALTLAHPPTDEDKANGFSVNWNDYREALVQQSCVSPELDAAQWAHLLDVLTPAQFALLADTCDLLNLSPVDVPFSNAASQKPRPSDAS